MSLRPIYGHDDLRSRLGSTLASSRFPQVTLLSGPAGVGKQRLALWVAQGLLCAEGPAAPCETCRSCQQVSGLRHPDLHWFVPIARPRATDPGKQVEAAREALGEIMAERRENPLWSGPEPMTSHALASVRVLRQTVAVTPFQGARKVVIVGDADRLIVQEASQEAANALLKVLEEPPADTTIMLTTAEPEALLPTIRSRSVPLRVSRVPDGAVRSFLESEIDPRPRRPVLERLVLLAEGCVGRVVRVAPDSAADRSAAELLKAVGRGPAAWASLALRQAPWAARGAFTQLLDALLVELRNSLAEAVAAGESEARRWVRAVRLVEEKRAEAQGNANPQLALAELACRLERTL